MIPTYIRSNFLLLALMASVITIPLSNNLNSIAIIIFVIACVIQESLGDLGKRLMRSKIWIVLILYYLWLVSSYFWDASGGYSVKDLERYSILLFIPAAMACIPKMPAKWIRLVCFAFVAVTCLVSVMCLVKSYIEYQQTHDSRVFYYHYLGQQMGLNAIFLSNYCLASITWLLYYSFVDGSRKGKGSLFIMLLTAIFLLMMILLLSSKLIIFLTAVVVIIFILGLGYVKGYFIRALIISLIVLTAGLLAAKNLFYLNYRINTTEIKMYKGKEDDQNGVAIRLFMWKIALDHISERPLLGYGMRGAKLETLKKYKETGFDLGISGNYHSHNEYLESALMAGIPATVLLLIFLFLALRRAILQKNFLLILMVLHFMIQSLIESTFEVQHELVFYIFFIFLFYYHAPEIKNNN